ncbi:hypothetical protein K4F52_009754 [Lecanicillium sp. MT-2017a]|nr:hypothetical protein K4F52_009754 [Lecanicillium sp. MT-2017a]
MEDPCGTNESTDPKFGSGPSENDNGGKKKRREQNRVAQKRYREKLAEKARQTDWLAKQATAFWHNLLEARQSGP